MATAQVTNPFAGKEQAAAEGREIFNRTCTVCHGMNGAAGDRGPALGAGRSYNIRTDDGIFNAIRDGIPGSAMPKSGLEVNDIWKVVSYIRSLRATASDAFVAGDVAAGEKIYWEKGRCGNCHMIRGRGGISGPDLSNVAGERTLAAVRDALTKPKLEIPRGYRPVDVATTDGRHLTGIAKNDNNFSLQLLDSNDQLQLFTSEELAKVTYKPQSLMPANYQKILAPEEFQNLLAFLSRQVTHKRERRRRSEDQ
jgi:putative heme-binding domain-containing protein